MEKNIVLNGMNIPTAFMSERLATLLPLVWSQIPDADRQSIVNYWLSDEQHTILNVPVLAVTDQMVNGKGLGATNMCGFMLRFWKKAVEEGFEDKVKDIIAHELAHVFDYSINGKDTEATESFANETMRRWGFDPDSLEEG